MDLSSCIGEKHVFCDVAASTKADVLHKLAKVASEATDLGEGQILGALRNRERLGSTGIGDGIALPHARFADLERPFGILIRLRKPIAFDAIDGEPTDIVFALLMPEGPAKDHLNVLAGVARRLRAPGAVEEIRRAEDARRVHQLLLRSPVPAPQVE